MVTDDALRRRIAELEQENAYLARSNAALARMLADAYQQRVDDPAPPQLAAVRELHGGA